ncbi:GNAT family N-acetyltransferase [Aliivibrio sifiae]|uniref:GNAT family N-acetyltransferase n=1 Tax=Aliivibrio sifiae TaxID=566293 RepID=UPI003D1135A7
MEVSLRQIGSDSRHILENLFHYYIYDMSEFMGWNPDESGSYSFKSATLDPYWKDINSVPYFLYADNELAGFALIRKYPDDLEVFDIEQFFVLRKFKGKGIGKNALMAILANHPGKWQIRILKENEAALKFWLSATRNVVGNCYQFSLDIDVDLEMHFIRFEKVS